MHLHHQEVLGGTQVTPTLALVSLPVTTQGCPSVMTDGNTSWVAPHLSAPLHMSKGWQTERMNLVTTQTATDPALTSPSGPPGWAQPSHSNLSLQRAWGSLPGLWQAEGTSQLYRAGLLLYQLWLPPLQVRVNNDVTPPSQGEADPGPEARGPLDKHETCLWLPFLLKTV